MQRRFNKGINLGRLWNKYLIIEIISFAAQEEALPETESVLWKSSNRLREFLITNRAWYPRLLTFIRLAHELKSASLIVVTDAQAKFIVDIVPEAKSFELLYRGSLHGWDTPIFQ